MREISESIIWLFVFLLVLGGFGTQDLLKYLNNSDKNISGVGPPNESIKVYHPPAKSRK